jgi:Mrp family chromosome partitioning ATPase
MPQQSAAIRDRAEPALFPSRPKVLLNLLLSAIAGISLGIALAFFVEYRTISVVSGGASEGKSTTTCNLAITFAGAGQRALIVDADMRRPSQHQLLDLENRIGLSDYLAGCAELRAVIQPTATTTAKPPAAGTAKPRGHR